MNNLLPVTNIFVVISMCFIKTSYGTIHWLISDLHRLSNGGNETVARFIRANDSIILPTIVISVGCLVTSPVLIRNERINKTLSVISLIISLSGAGYVAVII